MTKKLFLMPSLTLLFCLVTPFSQALAKVTTSCESNSNKSTPVQIVFQIDDNAPIAGVFTCKNVYGLRLGNSFDSAATDNTGLDIGIFFSAANKFTGLQTSVINSRAKKLYGLQLSGIYNHSDTFWGIQAAPFVNFSNQNINGKSTGLQIGLVNDARAFSGIQSGVLNMATSTSAIQLGIINYTRSSHWIQIGVLSISGESGYQASLIVNSSERNENGAPVYLQAGGLLVNYAGKIKGFQGIGFINYAYEVIGIQIGAANYAKLSVTGLQFGLANRGEEVRGVQIGMVNSAKTLHGLQIGFLNNHENGRIKILPLFNAAF